MANLLLSETFSVYSSIDSPSLPGLPITSAWSNTGAAGLTNVFLTQGRTPSRQALSLQGNGVQVSTFTAAIPPTSHLGAGLAFKTNRGGSGNVYLVNLVYSNGNNGIRLYYNNAGVLQIVRDTTVVATSSFVFSPGVFYYVELRCISHSTLGEVEVYIDGALVVSFTGNTGSLSFTGFSLTSGPNSQHVFSEVYLLDDYELLGDVIVEDYQLESGDSLTWSNSPLMFSPPTSFVKWSNGLDAVTLSVPPRVENWLVLVLATENYDLDNGWIPIQLSRPIAAYGYGIYVRRVEGPRLGLDYKTLPQVLPPNVSGSPTTNNSQYRILSIFEVPYFGSDFISDLTILSFLEGTTTGSISPPSISAATEDLLIYGAVGQYASAGVIYNNNASLSGTFFTENGGLVSGGTGYRVSLAYAQGALAQGSSFTPSVSWATGPTTARVFYISFAVKDTRPSGYRVIRLAPNGDYLYRETPSTSDSEIFSIHNLPVDPEEIYFVGSLTVSRKTDSGLRTLQTGLISGSTTSLGAPIPLSTSYFLHSNYYGSDPDTGLPWTTIGVNNLKLTYKAGG